MFTEYKDPKHPRQPLNTSKDDFKRGGGAYDPQQPPESSIDGRP